MQCVARSISAMQFQKINTVLKHSSITLQNGADDTKTITLFRAHKGQHCMEGPGGIKPQLLLVSYPLTPPCPELSTNFGGSRIAQTW